MTQEGERQKQNAQKVLVDVGPEGADFTKFPHTKPSKIAASWKVITLFPGDGIL